MRVCVFEDQGFEKLYPLTYLRPVFELRCGRTSLAQKIERAFPEAEVCYLVRETVAPSFAQRARGQVNDFAALRQDELLLVNGRLLLLGDACSCDPQSCKDAAYVSGDALVCARLSAETAAKLAAESLGALLDEVRQAVPVEQTEAALIEYPWHLVDHNAEAIVDDFAKLGRAGLQGKVATMAAIWGDEEKVYVAPEAEVHPFVTLDTREGPIIIDEGVEIHPYTRVEGPACIGRDSIIFGAKIREGTSIGPVCRVGGEVEESIIHGHSNKYHDGFLGHAYVCEWVNLGALTTNSDLKNDYSTVEVRMGGKLMDTGSTKVGAFIGDHTKTSIGTYFNTGSIVGIMCNLVGGSGIMPKTIPSFTMQLHGKFFKQGMNTLLKTARTAMGRRKVELTDADEALIRHTFNLTSEERKAAIQKSRRRLAAEKGLGS